MLTTPTDIEFKVVSDESTLTGDSESLMKITIQSKIPQLVASKPLITCDEDMEWDDMVARFIYRVCRMEDSSEGEQKKFWKRWKSVVYQNMRVRKNYVTGKIRERMVRKWHLFNEFCRLFECILPNLSFPVVEELMRNEKRGDLKRPWIEVTPQSMVQNYNHYKYFMDEFGSLMVGKSGFEMRGREREPEKWLSAAGEAFVLMSFENYSKWADDEVQGDSPPLTRESLANGITTAMLRDTKELRNPGLSDTRSCLTK